jgi:uncharacterized protein YqjF (DUF2071 family)
VQEIVETSREAEATDRGAMIDRLSIRTRPPGWPVMYQTWISCSSCIGPSQRERLQPLIAPRLSLDTFEGQAWVSVSPFTMWDPPVLLPRSPS